MVTVNKQAVTAAFGRAASVYIQCNELQRRSADLLPRHLARRNFAQVLDADCGPDSMSCYWRETGSVMAALDLSAGMLAQTRYRDAMQHYLQSDIGALPLPDGCANLAWSNLAVQWCDDLRAAIGKLCRVMRPGERVAFTTLPAGPLPELSQAQQAIDDRPHANRFLNEPAIGAVLNGLRTKGVVHQISLPFADALSAMRSLKGIGAAHLHQGRTSAPLGRGKLRELQLTQPQQQGICPLTYYLFTGVVERD